MSCISSIDKCLNPICFPWKYKKSGCEKIAAWAAFFFIGWICHPFYAICRACRAYRKVEDRGTIHSIGTQVLLRDPISEGLAGFNNSKVKGQINGIYITTNETNLEGARQLFKERPRPEDGISTIHIGCATWHNLDMICTRRSTYGLIIDFNPKNAEFIKKTIDLIGFSESRDAFKQAMIMHLNSLEGKEKELFFHADQKGLPTDRIEMELLREGSWLQSEENYLFIKQQLVAKDRLIAITEDITNFENFAKIRKFLDSNNIVIDTLYLSNICNFMRTPSDKNAFMKSTKHLLNADTIFINSRQHGLPGAITVRQQPVLGKEV